ncbi:MAG: glycosyltransferase family 4 protein [Deltaproteobacteria bacterium]|nr:MAG: glycosyltransferase family 4 protein [Deltaproteobacteria bacterium]
MRIFFYAPFKPLGHPHPSGDLMIATGLYDYFARRGHQVFQVSSLRSRWIFWKPWLWPHVLLERQRAVRSIVQFRPDLWLTYHTYYKAPDLLGPAVCQETKLPYVIFQGIYSTKRKRDMRTLPGYVLNKKALCASQHLFTNRREDLTNLERILPQNRLTYLTPGIFPEDFRFDVEVRGEYRRLWDVRNEPVILAAAMFRPGVKARGLAWVIRACGKLLRQGRGFQLVIVGDGEEKVRLHRLAAEDLPGKVRFMGKVPRNEMYRIYSACDIFAFPGIRESLGMVFLEAQSCGLPVVAFANGGIPEVVKDRTTGFLVPPFALDPFVQAIESLLANENLRHKMGQAARSYVRQNHDLNRNYRKMETVLEKVGRASLPTF